MYFETIHPSLLSPTPSRNLYPSTLCTVAKGGQSLQIGDAYSSWLLFLLKQLSGFLEN